ncbi:E3 ubiquitin-protein ligase TRIM21-like isoform X2 [Megalobrama amblycephala]|uniref:E3 ubiquitin-protein ligase TRIM21-like isoform X2 n=2 Tax=Megalobrama amblycephala TaxID=75352 RepID=UPI0020141C00|nr:E3 ubiquitin-protein ligase TRIM21-like isoform X2 [Megalobrama amblycephala]
MYHHLVQTQTDEQQMIQKRMKKIQEIKHSVKPRKTLVSNDCFLTSSRTVHISNWMIIGLGVLLVAALIILPKQYTRCQPEQLKMKEQQKKEAEKQGEDLIKELQQEITELKKRDTEQEKRNTELEKRNTGLEKRNTEQEKRNTEQEKRNTELEKRNTELEKRNTELEKRNTELEKRNTEQKKRNTEQKKRNSELSHTDDHLHLIQMYLNTLSHSNDSDVNSLKRALTELKEQLKEKLTQTELKFVQKFAVDVTLDPDTAYPYLILSDDGKQVSHGDIMQDFPENLKRFYVWFCVLAKQGFSSGRFYYEVQVKGKTQWELGVARESINRKEIWLSPDNGFWTVTHWNENQYAARESPSVYLSLRVKPEKVGVFVDYEEGLVSFYDVDSRSHIYSFTGQTFTEKLYPYFNPFPNDKGKNSKPLIITPVN